MKKIIFVLMILIYFPFPKLSAQNPDIARSIYYLEKEFGDIFIESLYSVDETRPYSIIQIDKVSILYNNNWLSPSAVNKMMSESDKKYLVDEMIKFFGTFDKQSEATAIVDKLRNWCLTKYEFDFVSDKMDVKKNRILGILRDIYAGYVNMNTGETIEKLIQNKDDEHEYYLLINFMSAFNQKEQFKIYAKLFTQLAEGK